MVIPAKPKDGSMPNKYNGDKRDDQSDYKKPISINKKKYINDTFYNSDGSDDNSSYGNNYDQFSPNHNLSFSSQNGARQTIPRKYQSRPYDKPTLPSEPSSSKNPTPYSRSFESSEEPKIPKTKFSENKDKISLSDAVLSYFSTENVFTNLSPSDYENVVNLTKYIYYGNPSIQYNELSDSLRDRIDPHLITEDNQVKISKLATRFFLVLDKLYDLVGGNANLLSVLLELVATFPPKFVSQELSAFISIFIEYLPLLKSQLNKLDKALSHTVKALSVCSFQSVIEACKQNLNFLAAFKIAVLLGDFIGPNHNNISNKSKEEELPEYCDRVNFDLCIELLKTEASSSFMTTRIQKAFNWSEETINPFVQHFIDVLTLFEFIVDNGQSYDFSRCNRSEYLHNKISNAFALIRSIAKQYEKRPEEFFADQAEIQNDAIFAGAVLYNPIAYFNIVYSTYDKRRRFLSIILAMLRTKFLLTPYKSYPNLLTYISENASEFVRAYEGSMKLAAKWLNKDTKYSELVFNTNITLAAQQWCSLNIEKIPQLQQKLMSIEVQPTKTQTKIDHTFNPIQINTFETIMNNSKNSAVNINDALWKNRYQLITTTPLDKDIANSSFQNKLKQISQDLYETYIESEKPENAIEEGEKLMNKPGSLKLACWTASQFKLISTDDISTNFENLSELYKMTISS